MREERVVSSTYRKLCNRIFQREIDTYGFNDIVRQYCNYTELLPMPFNIYHGWYVEVPRPADLESRRSLLLTFSKRQADEWRACSDKPVAVLGAPFIHYRRMMNIQRDKNAKGTIVYPAHTATDIDPAFDQRRLCEELAALESKHHPITVSVFESDIAAGRDNIYKQYGFSTFCPGSRKTLEFCRNFYGELAKHRYSCGNQFGTNILYSVEMGIPFFFIGELAVGVLRQTGEIVVKDRTSAHLKLLERVRTLFSRPVDEVTPEQSNLVAAESGVDDCLAPDELRQLMLRTFLTKDIPAVVPRAAMWPLGKIQRLMATKETNPV